MESSENAGRECGMPNRYQWLQIALWAAVAVAIVVVLWMPTLRRLMQ
jgi:hypothetical protein